MHKLKNRNMELKRRGHSLKTDDGIFSVLFLLFKEPIECSSFVEELLELMDFVFHYLLAHSLKSGGQKNP